MKDNVLKIDGVYQRSGTYHQFELGPDGFHNLAEVLRNVANNRGTVELFIDSVTLIIKEGSGTGCAHCQDGIIE